MKVFYLSQNRFTKRIEKKWIKDGFKYNSGHTNILKYAYRTVLYYANIEKQRISKVNKLETQPKLRI